MTSSKKFYFSTESFCDFQMFYRVNVVYCENKQDDRVEHKDENYDKGKMNPKNKILELTHAEEHNKHDNDCCKLDAIDNSSKNDPATHSKK